MMNKKISILFGIIVIALAVVGLVFYFQSKESSPSLPITQSEQNKLPSPTLKEYMDESGFFFNYPDDLSLTKNETDESTYADITLSSKEIAGSLGLRIEDSNIASADAWLRENTDYAKENVENVKFGKLDALALKNKEKLILAAQDSGVLFTLSVVFEDKEKFWTHAYEKIRSSFSFQKQTQNDGSSQGSVSDVQFEGEEIVE